MADQPAPTPASAGAPASTAGEPTFNPSLGAGSGQGLSSLGSLFASAVAGTPPPPTPPAAPEPAAPTPAPSPTPAAVDSAAPAPIPEVAPVPAAVNSESPKAKDFKVIKEQREAALREAESIRKEKEVLSTKLAEYEERLKTAVPADYEAIKAKATELESRIERIAVEKSDKFVAQFDRPMDETIARIKADVAGVEGFDIAELSELIQNPLAKNRLDRLNDLVSTLTPMQQSRVNARITKFEELSEARTAALENHKSFIVADQQALEVQQKTREAQYAKTIDDTLVLASEHIPYLKKIDGNEAHNAQVDAISAEIRKAWLEPTSGDELAKIVVAGKLAPRIYDHAVTLHNENVRLTKELADLKGATAKVQAGTSSAPVAAPKSISALFKQGAGFQSE